MKVLLQRSLFINGVRFRRNRYGTDIPDELTQTLADGSQVTRKVEYWKPDKNNEDLQDPEQTQHGRKGEVIVLPRDAVEYTSPDVEKNYDLLHNAGKARPTALSELNKPPERSARTIQPARSGAARAGEAPATPNEKKSDGEE